MASVSPLVSCSWLKEQLDGGLKGIRILDGSFHLPHTKRDAKAEYLEQHIEGSTHFDIDDVADTSNPLPHMLPSAEQFEEQVGKMGISNDTHVVVYDNNAKFGFYSAGRTWWMFQVFGHTKVSVLDGGLPKWLAEGYPTVSGPPPEQKTCSFKATYNPALCMDLKQMLDNYSTKETQVVDGRPKGRFDGTAPEPNPKIHSGQILGSVNLPFMQMINPDTKTMKDKAGILQEFEKANVDLSKPVVITCGGAVVAPLVAFCAHLVGKQVAVYDGSWADWVVNAPQETMKLGVKGEDLK